jgi:hypothetical protein
MAFTRTFDLLPGDALSGEVQTSFDVVMVDPYN